MCHAARLGYGDDAGRAHHPCQHDLGGRGIVPVRYLHAPSGIASVRDMEGALALTRALIFDLAKEV